MALVTDVDLSSIKKAYFVGIAGTGMATVACYLKKLGIEVLGSDDVLYEPMKGVIAQHEIPVRVGFAAEQIDGQVDIYIIGNKLSRGNVELEEILAKDLPYTSFPAVIGAISRDQKTIVVAGTHGKTTTTSLIVHLLQKFGLDPSCIIGGVAGPTGTSYRLGKGPFFVVEGDEYDTAFFDKKSKFLHYHPRYLVLNNIEFDHADIFPDFSAVKKAFSELVDMLEHKGGLIAHADDRGVLSVAEPGGDLVVSTSILSGHHSVCVTKYHYRDGFMDVTLKVGDVEEIQFRSQLLGAHNLKNVVQAVGLVWALCRDKWIDSSKLVKGLKEGLASFSGVARRLQCLHKDSKRVIYEDFGHHPTAVSFSLQTLRECYPRARIVAAIELKSAIARRNILFKEYVAALEKSDVQWIGECTQDNRIRPEHKMDTAALARALPNATAAHTNAELLDDLQADTKDGDVVVFFSSGSFSGIQYELVNRLSE